MQRVAKIFSYMMAAAAGALVAYVAMRPGAEVRDEVAVEPVRATVPAAPLPAVAVGELARLEKENVDLETQLVETRRELAAREAAWAKTKESLEELRRPMTEDILSSSLRAEMKSGEAIVTGGYRLPDGKRLYAFATPVLEESANGGEQVKIGFQMFRMTDEASEAVGLDTLSTNAANTLQHGEVWVADEYAAIVEKLKTTPGMEGTSYAPDIMVNLGSTGAVEAGTFRLKVTPQRAEAGGGLNVELRLEQPAVTETPESAKETQAEAVTSP